jgi:hypothetical protein
MKNPGPFKDPPYENVNIYHQTDVRYVQLQGPALRAFKAAEARLNHRILLTGHGYRSYDTQKALYDSVKGTPSEGRYADPDGSMHVEALAVDVDTGQRFKGLTRTQTQNKIRKALEAEGFHYGVSGEPWHASFKLSG